MSQMDSYQMKHTPGPWDVTTSRDVFSAVIASGRATICMDVENDADAALIASAPDLLAALKKCVHELNEIRARDGVPYTHYGIKASVCEEYFSSVVDESFAAISKAEGVA